MIKLANPELLIKKMKQYVPINLDMPALPGEYLGYFMVEDFSTKEIISALPIRTYIKQKEELLVDLFSSEGIPEKDLNVNISIRDKNKNPLDAIIIVNGKAVEIKQGKGS